MGNNMILLTPQSELEGKTDLYVNPTTPRCQKNKSFLLEYLREFLKNSKRPNGILRSLGETDS
jgi:hypothetical protein